MKLPRIPQINDLPALIELLADHKKHLAHLEELAGLHDLLNKKLQGVENLDAIEGMLSDAKAKVEEANSIKAEAVEILAKAGKDAYSILSEAKADAAKVSDEASQHLHTADKKQIECDALHSQLETQLEKVVEERGRLKAETAYLIEQSKAASNLREELAAKVKKVSEVFV